MTLSIRQMRLIKGFSQRYMAEKLKVHVQTYRRMEKFPGDMTINFAKQVAEILDMPYNDIFFS